MIDRWMFYLPALSIAVVLIAVSRRYPMRILFYLSIVFLVLIILALVNVSVWSSISIENKTTLSLSAVSVDLKNHRTRLVSINPQQKRKVALTEAGDLELAKGYGYHVFVYDAKGNVYYDETLLPEELRR